MYHRGDFHIHSTFSDGKHTPQEIVMLCKKKNIDIIALTDHNTTAGIDEAILVGEKLGVKVIPGVELSTSYKGSKVHILGYFKDDSYKNELFLKILKNIKNHTISPIKSLFKNDINFYDSKYKLYVKTGIDILRFFGAIVILAHPVILTKANFNDIIEMNFNGIEAKYFSNTNEDTEFFIKTAYTKNIIYTAGSDFHSLNTKKKTHGIIGDVYLNENEISNFLITCELPY